jgi:hypothetical protein
MLKQRAQCVLSLQKLTGISLPMVRQGTAYFTFTRHPVKIGTITKKNESVHILAGKTRCCGFSLHNGGQSKIAELRLLTNEPG